MRRDFNQDGEEDVELTFSHKHTKNTLHVEKFLLNTNWRYQKDSCTTKVERKI